MSRQLTELAERMAGWDRGLRPIHAVHHQIGNLRIDVHDSRAAAPQSVHV